MNNKGFAITSLIYGLALLGIMLIIVLMGTLSSSRNNVKEEAERVEEFLLAVNQSEITFRDSGTYEVPSGQTGWYRIEAFGRKDCNGGANGAYATGIAYFKEGEKYDVVIGNCSNNSNTSVSLKGTENTTLIIAGRGIGNSPGGTTSAYNSISNGGVVSLDNYSLDGNVSTSNYYGMKMDNYSSSGDNKSYINGYPLNCDTTHCMVRNPLADGLMLPGASSLTSGKVIIERLATEAGFFEDSRDSTIPLKNHKLGNAKAVRVESSLDIDQIYVKIDINSPAGIGDDIYTYKCSDANKHNCYFVFTPFDDTETDLMELNVIFKQQGSVEETNIYNTKITTYHFDGSNDVVFDSSYTYYGIYSYGIPNSPLGIHLSALQPDFMSDSVLSSAYNFSSHGNYYLIPVTSPNKVVSASSSTALDSNKIKIEYMTGEVRQKWAIDLINSPTTNEAFPNIPNVTGRQEFRIMELARYKSLSLYYDENFPLNNLVATQTFNSLSRNEPQIWNIYSIADGTYAIKTVVPSHSTSNRSGFLLGITNVPSGESRDHIDEVVVGGDSLRDATDFTDMYPTNAERFFIYSLDFSE